MIKIYSFIIVMIFSATGCVPTFDEEDDLADVPGILGVNAGNEKGNIPATTVIDSETYMVTVFVEDETVDFSNIYISVSLDQGCIIEPIEGATPCGTYGDFSSPNKYRVTAPSGRSADWTIVMDYQ